MSVFERVETDTLLSGEIDWIGTAELERLSQHPFESLETEYPHYVGSVDSPEEFERPSEQHPVFYGCFDWHSAVHSHWSLVRQLRLFDDHPRESAIERSIDARLTSENVEREVAFFADNPAFEKPYGWGWLLRLVAELHCWEDDRADEWRRTLEPLEERIVELVEAEFLAQERPFRVGTHGNSAFALQCVLDYARVTANDHLESATLETSRAFFAADRNYPVEYEPLGWDFLSPALVEADLLRRVLAPAAFAEWLDGFLPDVTEPPYDALLEPTTVDADEDVALHYVGLNVSKAWCLAGIAAALDDHPYTEAFERSAACHAERGIERAFEEDYAGTHWLSSFVLYLLTRNAGTIAPSG